MQEYIAVTTITLLIIFVIMRSIQLKKCGIKVCKFGHMDKKRLHHTALCVAVVIYNLFKRLSFTKGRNRAIY